MVLTLCAKNSIDFWGNCAVYGKKVVYLHPDNLKAKQK
jgi:hypothetical protein